MTLPVSEVFADVWQGEGPHAGRRCSFLRLGLCNLHCSWCDTPYTWDHGRYNVAVECPQVEPSVVLGLLAEHQTSLLVLSGGEPMIHARNGALQAILCAVGHEVHVETNGTIMPPLWLVERVAHWSVSPKINEQGDPAARRLRPTVIRYFAQRPNAIFKIVVRDAEEVRHSAWYLSGLGARPEQIWFMPEGIDGDELLDTARVIAPAVADARANLTLRQHVLLFGNERRR